MKVTRIKPGDPVLRHRPDVKYRADVETQSPKATVFPNGERVILSRSVVGYGMTREAAIAEATEMRR